MYGRVTVRTLGQPRLGSFYRDKVTEVIKDSTYLKEFQERVVKEETTRLTKQGGVELFQGLVNNDPSIAQLLPGGMLVTLPGYVGREEKEEEKWQGKYSPTFLDLVGRSLKEEGAEIAIDGRRRVLFKSDVVNGYLSRPGQSRESTYNWPRQQIFANQQSS